MGDDNAVYLGNLKNDIRISILKENIMHMFRTIGITITKGKIDVINKVHTVYAFVYLSSCDEQQHVLDLLQDNNVLMKLDLTDVVQYGKTLKVAPKLDSKQLYGKQKGSPPHSTQHHNGDQLGQQGNRFSDIFAEENIRDSSIPEGSSNNSVSSAHGSALSNYKDNSLDARSSNIAANSTSAELDPTDTDSSESADVVSCSHQGKTKAQNTAQGETGHPKQTKKSRRKLNSRKRQKQNINEELHELNTEDIYHSKQPSDPVFTADFFHKDYYSLGEFIGKQLLNISYIIICLLRCCMAHSSQLP